MIANLSFMFKRLYITCLIILLSIVLSAEWKQPAEEEIYRIESLNDYLVQKDFNFTIQKVDLFPDLGYEHPINDYIIPEKFTITSLNPLNREMDLLESVHLLRRTIFGPQIEEINYIQTLSTIDAVDYILRDIESPIAPGDWVDHPFPDVSEYSEAQYDSLNNAYVHQFRELIYWWTDEMYYNETHIREQMTLFWHDHFATSAATIFFPPAMYHQNRKLRENSLGNFKELVTSMTFDPAMMIWLDNNQNFVGQINENFARELLELFTLGEGNYTQVDITEAARALTGYTTDGLNIYFHLDHHDDGLKTFLGQTGYFDAEDIIDIIFEQPQTAHFISEKLYRWFVYENPNDEIVDQLAQIMIENNYEIKPVLNVLFNSEHFYDDNFYGAKYKNPVSHSVGIMRQLYFDTNQPIDFPYTVHEILLYIQEIGGQTIFYPPDVAGWPGYRNWINTFTLPWRKVFTNYLVDGTFNYVPDPIEFAERIPNGLSDPDALLDYLYIYFYSIQPSDLTKQNLMDELLAGADPFEWHLIYYDGAIERFGYVIQRMMRLSEFQLK